MNAEAWTLVLGVMALVLNIGAFAVGYGVLKGQVTALAARVHALEGEMSALQDLKVTVAEVKTTMNFVLEQFKDLNASIRWMRAPAEYGQGETPPPAKPSRGAR